MRKVRGAASDNGLDVMPDSFFSFFRKQGYVYKIASFFGCNGYVCRDIYKNHELLAD